MTGSVRTDGGRMPGAIRKVVAAALLVPGVTGLAVAAATQLNSAWSGDFQAGSTPIAADCQPAGEPIRGRLAAPVFVATGDQPWAVTQVEFLGISPDCAGHQYEVAYRAGGDWIVLGTESARGTVSGSTITADLGGLLVGDATEFAISIQR